MNLTKDYLVQEITKINNLVVSGSLHEIDEASHISARLLEELSSQESLQERIAKEIEAVDLNSPSQLNGLGMRIIAAKIARDIN